MIRNSLLNVPKRICFVLILLATASSPAWGHTGHKHDAFEPKVKLPETVAMVNGVDIKKDAVWQELKNILRQQGEKGKPLSVDQEKAEAKKLIEQEIDRRLLLQKGEDLGIKTSPDKVIDQVIEKEIKPQVAVGADEIKRYYEKNKSMFWNEEKARASVILIRVQSDGEEQAKARIESLLEQVKGGADFAELAKKHSQDKPKLAARGGDLGYFTKKRMLAAFSERAFRLKVGEVSEVFKTRHGYHILKVTDRVPSGHDSLEKVEGNIRDRLTQQKIAEKTRDYLNALRSKGKIKIYF